MKSIGLFFSKTLSINLKFFLYFFNNLALSQFRPKETLESQNYLFQCHKNVEM